MDEITLPLLPLPDHAGPNGTGTYFSAWTETQVRDAQRAAVLLDRQRRDKPAPSTEPVESQLVMLARILRCRYPVDKSIRSNGFDWDISRLNEVVAELHLTAPSAEPFSPKEIALMNEKWLHRKALGLAEAAPSAEPVDDGPDAKRFTAKQLHAIKLRGYQDAEAVMRQALEALIKARDTTYSDTLYPQCEVAIDALRKALEEK